MRKFLVIFFGMFSYICLNAQQYPGAAKISQQEKLNDEYCTGLFKSHDGIILDISSNESARNYLNILNWLDGRVSGLQIYYSRDRTPVPFMRNSRANIFVDEVPVDPGYLNDLSIADIAIIKVIKGPFAGAFGNGAGGTLAIYTLKGDDDGDEGEALN